MFKKRSAGDGTFKKKSAHIPLRIKVSWVLLAGGLLYFYTADTRLGVRLSFPEGIYVDQVLYFETKFFECTFAEVSTFKNSAVDPEVLQQSEASFLASKQQKQLRARFNFPEGGFAAFEKRSLLDLTGLEGGRLDSSLGYAIGEHIFSSRGCWDELRNQKKFKQVETYSNLVRDKSGIVFIGDSWPHTIILFFPERNRAYYLNR